MRLLIVSMLILGCATPGDSQSEGTDVTCEWAEALSPAVAFRRMEQLGPIIEERSAKLTELQESNSSVTQPEEDEAGEALGEVLGEAWVLCSCNEQLSPTEDCFVFRNEMEYWFGDDSEL